MSCDSNVSGTVKAAESEWGLQRALQPVLHSMLASQTRNPWEKRKKDAETEAANLLTGYTTSGDCNRETKRKLSKETENVSSFQMGSVISDICLVSGC